ncbi:MAG: hypothetical protein ACR2RA_11345 [Geminicoccaceae bacterium]
MTIIRTSLIAALGLLVVGSVAPTSASATAATKPNIALSEVVGLHLATDRGSWVEPRTRWKHDYENRRRYDRYDDRHHHRKYYKKKKRKKFYKRGFRRGYDRGYDEGYYEGRRRSYDRRHYHRRHRDYGCRGGIYFGDGYYGGPCFRFRY